MAKALAGVKYGKLTSKPKPRTYPAAGGGRSGPPMVDIGSKGERKGTAMTVRSGKQPRFGRVGSVSQSSGNTGPSSRPTIGSPKGRSGRVGPY